ncbi:MAG: hypothetical protein WA705_15390 [Candidatus Ozemobacteraceae bacterium]
MKIEVAPEELFWEYIEEKLCIQHDGKSSGFRSAGASHHHRGHSSHSKKNSSEDNQRGPEHESSQNPKQAAHHEKRQWTERARKHILSLLPEKIEVSEGFVERWKHLVHTTIQMEVVHTYGLRPFLFIREEQTHRLTAADPDFWNQIHLSFSPTCVQNLWEVLRNTGSRTEPDWRHVTPSDALMLSILIPQLCESFPFEWLAERKAPWIVVAMFLRHRRYSNPEWIPWRPYLMNPSISPLPLRELLIEHTADLFKTAITRFEDFLGSGESPGRGIYQQSPLHGTRFSGEPIERIRGKVDFCFNSPQAILPLIRNKAYEAEQVKTAVRSWFNDATLGLDDARYLESAAVTNGFFENIDTLQRILNEYQVIQKSVAERNEP